VSRSSLVCRAVFVLPALPCCLLCADSEVNGPTEAWKRQRRKRRAGANGAQDGVVSRTHAPTLHTALPSSSFFFVTPVSDVSRTWSKKKKKKARAQQGAAAVKGGAWRGHWTTRRIGRTVSPCPQLPSAPPVGAGAPDRSVRLVCRAALVSLPGGVIGPRELECNRGGADSCLAQLFRISPISACALTRPASRPLQASAPVTACSSHRLRDGDERVQLSPPGPQ
jgi:hypothetical protein